MKKLFLLHLTFCCISSANFHAQTAAFSVDTNAGCVPVCVSFTDMSMNAVSWAWDFGDASTSTSQNPFHCYTNAGTYTVTLVATFPNSSTDTATAIITSYPRPTASFTWVNTGGTTIAFTDQSIGAAAWEWSFGDANTSTLQNPAHTYASPGNYFVSMGIYNAFGCYSSDTSYIVITGIQEQPINFNWVIYPNPARENQVTIHCESLFHGPELLRIENSLGQVVLQQEVTGSSDIQIGFLPAGIYLVAIGEDTPRKLMVQ